MKKKTCSLCKEKFDKEEEFCPNCGIFNEECNKEYDIDEIPLVKTTLDIDKINRIKNIIGILFYLNIIAGAIIMLLNPPYSENHYHYSTKIVPPEFTWSIIYIIIFVILLIILNIIMNNYKKNNITLTNKYLKGELYFFMKKIEVYFPIEKINSIIKTDINKNEGLIITSSMNKTYYLRYTRNTDLFKNSVLEEIEKHNK